MTSFILFNTGKVLATVSRCAMHLTNRAGFITIQNCKYTSSTVITRNGSLSFFFAFVSRTVLLYLFPVFLFFFFEEEGKLRVAQFSMYDRNTLCRFHVIAPPLRSEGNRRSPSEGGPEVEFFIFLSAFCDRRVIMFKPPRRFVARRVMYDGKYYTPHAYTRTHA